MRISDWSSDVCSSDLVEAALLASGAELPPPPDNPMSADRVRWEHIQRVFEQCDRNVSETARRSEEHTSELQSLMRISYAVFCLQKKKHIKQTKKSTQ